MVHITILIIIVILHNNPMLCRIARTTKHIHKYISLTNTVTKTMSSFAQRLNGFDRPTVWHEFTPLANKHGAVNLGQGFPDMKCPQFAKDSIVKAVNEDFNQYCRSAGEINLVKALAVEYSEKLGRSVDPLTEIATSVGATECLFAIMQAFVEAGDEVVMMEPAFDIYPAQVQMAGGIPVTVPMVPPDPEIIGSEWSFNLEQLEAAITSRSRILLLNTPHNPTGRILSIAELEAVANIAKKNPRLIVVCDEVYEHLIFSSKGHTRLASLPGMWERTITVSSSGKTFSITGWKIGWAVGCAELITPIMLANQWVQFSVSTPAQKAVADMLTIARQPFEQYSSYYEYLNVLYRGKLVKLADAAKAAGLIPLAPEGGFFLLCDTRNIELPAAYLEAVDEVTGLQYDRDWAFCRWMTAEIGVCAIPPSAFYGPGRKHYAANIIRLCFAKMDVTLDEAASRLLRLKPFAKVGTFPDEATA